MNRIPWRWWSFGALALTGIVFVAVSLFSLRNYRAASEATVDAAIVVLREAVLVIHLFEAQSAKRGYILTGNEAFRTEFQRTTDLLATDLNNLDTREDWTPEQRASLDDALAAAREMRGLFQESVDLMAAGHTDEAVASTVAERDEQLMARVQDSLSAVAVVETARRNESESDADQRAVVLAIAIGVLAIVATGLSLWVVVSLRRRGEAESLRRSNQAKDEVLAMLGHELRSPVAIIEGHARVLRTGFDSLDAEERFGFLGELEQEAGRIAGMVGQMMMLSGGDLPVAPELQPTRVPDIVNSAAQRAHLLHPEAEIVVYNDANLNLVLANAGLTEQVVENLLSNAIKYGPPGLPIEIRARNRGQSVEISVIDGGAGIRPELRDRIFEPFVRVPGARVHQDGLGLGLAVCKRLMRAQGGDIWVDGGSNPGTSFTLSLPIVTAEIEA